MFLVTLTSRCRRFTFNNHRQDAWSVLRTACEQFHTEDAPLRDVRNNTTKTWQQDAPDGGDWRRRKRTRRASPPHLLGAQPIFRSQRCPCRVLMARALIASCTYVCKYLYISYETLRVQKFQPRNLIKGSEEQ